jgi:hypothetical protein
MRSFIRTRAVMSMMDDDQHMNTALPGVARYLCMNEEEKNDETLKGIVHLHNLMLSAILFSNDEQGEAANKMKTGPTGQKYANTHSGGC